MIFLKFHDFPGILRKVSISLKQWEMGPGRQWAREGGSPDPYHGWGGGAIPVPVPHAPGYHAHASTLIHHELAGYTTRLRGHARSVRLLWTTVNTLVVPHPAFGNYRVYY